jgi:tRNA(Ser,Leu) C12 N-acetylase TAN1
MAEVMPSFNLLISTAADFEEDCFNEVWYHLFALGDENPTFVHLYIPGLIAVQTKVDARKFIAYLKEEGKKKGIKYFKFIFKVIPIDSVVLTSQEEIIKRSGELIESYRKSVKESDTFRVKIVRRFTELKTESLIPPLAKLLQNKVDLKKPDWEIRVEICRKITGISILREDDVFEPKKQKIDAPASPEASA